MAVAPDDPTYAGQAVYTPGFLRMYDTFVLRFNGGVLWRCPPSRLVQLYDDNVSSPHLDIGVGTGYLLDKCEYPTPSPDITLMDLNPSSLEAASKRLSRYAPKTHQGNALEPFGLPPGSFQSVGLNWLLHCLPGDIASKSVVFDHCKTVLAPGGVVFGSTVLTGGVRHTPWSRLMLKKVNDDGVFDNFQDDLEGLARELQSRFANPRLSVKGTVALFSAQV